ncbi:MAG: FGGY family carbohydrate kinase [Spirochaetales bacterium]|nr:FGGY family carbohydrate kinase [Spirochaetales bacterium]
MNLEKSSIGIEFGSTRIKAVLVDENYIFRASGSYKWENSKEGDIWTYSLEEAIIGLQSCFALMKSDYEKKYNQKLTVVGSIGISGMMHGYLVFDKNDSQICEYRTWRNTITQKASEELSDLFDFNVPQRWSISHLYHAILNNENHVKDIEWMTTLSGFVHFVLTGQKIIGVGDASGMFPIDEQKADYDEIMIQRFDSLVKGKLSKGIYDILPRILKAGEIAGYLTKEGSRILDVSGELMPGIPFCPCEGDAETGMVATNSIGIGTGNISAGTSIFAMIVTGRRGTRHREIDIVTTPTGECVSMIHCNNGTSDLDGWIEMFGDFLKRYNGDVDHNKIYEILFKSALEGSSDCNGMININYVAGEEITKFNEGSPIFTRLFGSEFSFADLSRTLISSIYATLSIGLRILQDDGISFSRITGHGGLFKTGNAAQIILSAALGVPVSTMNTAGEGGSYGIAILAKYMIEKTKNESLESYLSDKVYAESEIKTVFPKEEDIRGYKIFLDRYSSFVHSISFANKAREV